MANRIMKRGTIFMNIRKEIKPYFVREGFTMSELVEMLAEQYGWSPSVPNPPISCAVNPCAIRRLRRWYNPSPIC